MTITDYYRLEYNEKQGAFKYDSFSKRKETPYGWDTIAMVISLEDVRKFLESVKITYPQIDSGEGENYPNTNTIRKMFNDYIGISEL
jgi:hypothetical protein